MSPRIVITSWGSYGDIYPYLGLGRALAAAGAEVVLAVPEYYRGTVEAAGIGHRSVGPGIDPADRALVSRVMDPARGPEALVRDILVPALERTVHDLREATRGADLLVTHPVTFAGPVVAALEGVPWVSTVLAPLSFFSATDPPVLPAVPWLAGVARRVPWAARLLARTARRATAGWMAPVHALRRAHGLPPGGHPLFEGQFSPTLTLALFSPVFAPPQPDWPAQTRTTGFVFHDDPADVLPPSLESFLAAGAPPVVFTLGTSAVHAAGAFYAESVAAARALGVRAVLLTGGIEGNLPAGRLPDDVLAVDRAPHARLFPRASAVVHQGGVGTTAQALRAGRPMLVVPHAHDQADNAARAVRLGVARTLGPRAYVSRRVVPVLAHLLSDAAAARHAERTAVALATEDGAREAAQALLAAAGA